MIDLAIQLVNFKTKKYLQSTIQDLKKDLEGGSFSWNINIVDNNSGDDLSDLEKVSPDNTNFYYSPKNVGFGAGHNFLSKKVQAKYLLILNTDLKFIESKTIQRLMDNITSKSTVKVVGPTLITTQRRVQWWDHAHHILALPCRKKHTELGEVAWVSGAVFLIEKKTFDEIGGFDENFFLYGEEIDLCLRITKQKGSVLYDPSIKVLHYGGVVANPARYIKKSKNYFLDKHYRKSLLYLPLKVLNYLFPM